MKFVEVILPIPLPGTFTYALPEEDAKKVLLHRVLVQFGKKKIYTGVATAIHDESPSSYQPKEILEILDDHPILHPIQLNLLNWMSSYYLCSLGEALNACLPGGLKISSESYLSINARIDPADLDLTDREFELLEILKGSDKTYDQISKDLNLKSSYRYIKSLSEKGALDLFERLKDKYTPKIQKRIRLSSQYTNEQELENLVNGLNAKPKQQQLIVGYLQDVPVLEMKKANEKGLEKRTLKAKGSDSSLKTLIKKGVFEEWDEQVSRISQSEAVKRIPKLSDVQVNALDQISSDFQSKMTVLLHGITGSGKTEIYISLIQKALDSGGSVLLLLPEIALTTQMIQRLAGYLGGSFGVYHSRYSESERVEVWQKVLSGEFKFVVGVRSAIFLPFKDLSLIIVDEEHEPSYKQYDPAPRYHARDSAIYLGNLHGAKVLLGTATPSIETYYNALNQKYGLVKLNVRFDGVQLPKVEFADLTKGRKKRTNRGNFSRELLEEIEGSLAKKEQIILFQNRRGYAAYVDCRNCSHVPKCPNCDVSLSYHIYQNHLLCHYCGFKSPMTSECESCGANEVKLVSFGTEQLEEEMELMFPEARVQRMDLDSTRSKYSYQRIIDDFESGDIDVLVGTQMVTKGLDFDRVNLVGVFDTDRMIHFPDFRSHERAFQLLEQVSGRAGRKKMGKVIIQTTDPSQPLLRLIEKHDYLSFYQREVLEREQFQFPPFFRLIGITVKHKDKVTALEAANALARELRLQLGNRVQGPIEPLIGRIRNQFLFEIIIKLEKEGLKIKAIKEFLLTSRNMITSQRLFRSVRIVFDVDPV